MLCISAGATLLLVLGGGDFSLAWRHSVTRDEWVEHWHAGGEGLRLLAADVKGPGAGLEIPEGAIRTASGWHFTLDRAAQAELILAASGTTGGGWELCEAGRCHALGADPGAPVRLRWQEEGCKETGL